MVDGLGEPQLEDLRLQPPLQEVLEAESQHVIQLHLALIQHADPHQTPEESVSLEQSPGVLLLQGEKFPGSRPDLGQAILDAPYL